MYIYARYLKLLQTLFRSRWHSITNFSQTSRQVVGVRISQGLTPAGNGSGAGRQNGSRSSVLPRPRGNFLFHTFLFPCFLIELTHLQGLCAVLLWADGHSRPTRRDRPLTWWFPGSLEQSRSTFQSGRGCTRDGIVSWLLTWAKSFQWLMQPGP